MQRKVFRIERTFGDRIAQKSPRVADPDPQSAPRTRTNPERVDTIDDTAQTFKRQLGVLHDTFARHKRELAALIDDGKELRMARAAGELAAAVEGMEKATENILKTSEAIDDCARTLLSTLDTDDGRGAAKDIQEHVVRIYEACNFQDLAGQRIGKVIATLNMIEDQVAGMLDRYKDGTGQTGANARAENDGLINGPRLDGDSGHASQCDIDELFG